MARIFTNKGICFSTPISVSFGPNANKRKGNSLRVPSCPFVYFVAFVFSHEWHEFARIRASVSPPISLYPLVPPQLKEKEKPFVPIRVIRGLYFFCHK